MKITGPTGGSLVNRLRGAKSGAAQGAAKTSQTSSTIEIAGVPEAELTPKVRRALASLMGEVQELRAELAAMRGRISELEELADTDPLVGAFNRRAFVREVHRALGMAERYGAPSSLIFADVDNMKAINDQYGHAAGDAALAHIAKVLAENIRRTDAVGRLGGDEFGVILTQTEFQAAITKAETLTEQVAGTLVDWEAGPFQTRISCGVVDISRCSTAESALELADAAMYKVKKSRKTGEE